MNLEWKNCCRLCANSEENLRLVFEVTEQRLSEKIFKYLSISIENEDKLPQQICDSCFQQIGAFDRYAEQCMKVQIMFRSMIEESNKELNINSDTQRLQKNQGKEASDEMIDSKDDIELLAIDADPFLPLEGNGPPGKKGRPKGGKKKNMKSNIVVRSRTKRVPRVAAKTKETERERRTSSRLQGIAQMQKDFGTVTDNVSVKEETEEEENYVGENEVHSTKKRGRIAKTLVGAAKRKAKMPRVVKQKADGSAGPEIVSSTADTGDDKIETVEEVDGTDVPVSESTDDCGNKANVILEKDFENDIPKDKSSDGGENDGDDDDDDEEEEEEEKEANSEPPIFRWECHVCNQVFRSWNSLSMHCRSQHQVNAQVVCLCAKVLASRASIIKHRLKHTNAYKFRCEKCDKAFHRKSLYDLHVLSHVPKEEQPFVCCKCARRFHCESLLRHHERVHLPREERLIYPCSVCNKKFSSRSNVTAHLRAVHYGERPFVCDQCGHSFTSKGILLEHLTIHSDETPFKCSQCKKSFKTKYRLKIHMDTHRETPYQCPICPHQLSTRRTLRMHLLVHKDVKAYQCATCGKAFKRSKDLKNHHNLHTGRRPYTCTFCPRTFANGSNCRAHKRKMHTEELRLYEASLAAVAAAAENDGSSIQNSLNPIVSLASNVHAPDQHLINSHQGPQNEVNGPSLIQNSPTPESKPILNHNIVSEFGRHSIFDQSVNINTSLKSSPHIPRPSNHSAITPSSTPDFPQCSSPEVHDANRTTMGHLVHSEPNGVNVAVMSGLPSNTMVPVNCRNPHQMRPSHPLPTTLDATTPNRNIAAMNLNISRRNINTSENMLNSNHLASLTPLNLNVSEMHSNRHHVHLSDSPSMVDIEENTYMQGARRALDNFSSSRAHIPNLNTNIQIHRQQQHQNLATLSRSLVEREMSVTSNLNRMHHTQHASSVPSDAVVGLQGYSSLNHLYQHHAENMPSAVAAAIAHSSSMSVPAFPVLLTSEWPLQLS